MLNINAFITDFIVHQIMATRALSAQINLANFYKSGKIICIMHAFITNALISKMDAKTLELWNGKLL